MRKVILFLPVLISFHLLAQNEPKAALSVGSDTYLPYQGEGVSITQNNSVVVIPYEPEEVISQGSAKTYPEPKSTTSKDVIVLLAGLLIATAIYFVFRKNTVKSSSEISTISLEDENSPDRKKELWNKMSAPQEEDNK